MVKKKRVKFLVIIFCIFFGMMICLVGLQKNLSETIIAMSSATIRSITTTAVNDAIYLTLDDSVHYEDLIITEKDNQGKITMLKANSIKINKIARDTAYVSQKNLEDMGEQGISLPLGIILGSPIFAGFGPDIHIKIIPVGSVMCEFVSEFEKAGINQVRHMVYLDVIADIHLIMPTGSRIIASKTQVLLSESIIVGDVPNTFLSFSPMEGQYNLVPNIAK